LVGQPLGGEDCGAVIPDLSGRNEVHGGEAVAGDDLAERHHAAQEIGNAGSGGVGRQLFHAGDRDGLTAALTAILDTDPVAMGAAADQLRADVSRRYDWDVATDLLEAAYRHAIGRRRPPEKSPAPSGTGERASQVLAR